MAKRHIIALTAATFALAACDPVVHRSEAETIAEDFADAAAAAAKANDDLEARVAELEKTVERLDKGHLYNLNANARLRYDYNHHTHPILPMDSIAPEPGDSQ